MAVAALLTILVCVSGQLSAGPAEAPADQRVAPPDAPAVTPKAKHVFFHTLPNSVVIGGVTTRNVMDTVAGGNFTEVSSSNRVVGRWYLYPGMPDTLELNGTAMLSFWVRGTGALNGATLTAYVFAIDSTGNRVPVFQGVRGPPVVPMLAYREESYSFSIPPITIPPNGTLEVQMDLNGASATTYIVGWGNSTLDSGVILPTVDHIEVARVATLDHLRRPRVSFFPNTANKTMFVSAEVADPFGGYDVRWVNVTIRDPGGAEIIANMSMPRMSGFFNSYLSTFEFSWNYSGRTPGTYNSTVYAVDQNGYRAWTLNNSDRTYGGHLVWANFTFTIGSFPHYVNFRVTDAAGAPLPTTRLIATIIGVDANSNITDAAGIANVTLFRGTYTMVAVWQDVNVSAALYTVTGNVDPANAVPIAAWVYSPEVRVVDSNGFGLERASVFVTHPNGSTTVVPYRTNASGSFSILRAAAGAYRFRASWLGVEVADAARVVNSSATFIVAANAFHLGVKVIDAAGAPLGGASAVARNSSTGTVMDSRLTDAGGVAAIVLPLGTYDFDVLWVGALVSGLKSHFVGADGNVTVVASVYYLRVAARDSRGVALANASVVVTSESSGELLGVSATDGTGVAVSRVPTVPVRVQVRWLDVLVAVRSNVSITGNLTLDIAASVFYVKFRPVDSHGVAVDAFVSASNSTTSRLYAAGLAAAGETELRLPMGPSRMRAHWLTAQVYDSVLTVGGDITVTLDVSVFYATLQIRDSRQKGLGGAQVRAAQLAGEVRAEGTADDGGNVTLRLPAVDYTLRAHWKGVEVLVSSLAVSADSSRALDARVFYVDVVTKDANGAALSPVYLRAADAGVVRDAGYSTDGKFALRLPASNYTIRARFAASYYLTDFSWDEQRSVDLRGDVAMEFVVTKFPVPFYITIAFWAGFAAVILILMNIFLLSRLRGAPPMFLRFLSKREAKVEGAEPADGKLVSGPDGVEVAVKDVERDEGPAVEPGTIQDEKSPSGGDRARESSGGRPSAGPETDGASRERANQGEVKEEGR